MTVVWWNCVLLTNFLLGVANFETNTQSVMSDFFKGKLAESHEHCQVNESSGLESCWAWWILEYLTGWAAWWWAKWAGITISTLFSILKERSKKCNPFGMNPMTWFSLAGCKNQTDEHLIRNGTAGSVVGVNITLQKSHWWGTIAIVPSTSSWRVFPKHLYWAPL